MIKRLLNEYRDIQWHCGSADKNIIMQNQIIPEQMLCVIGLEMG